MLRKLHYYFIAMRRWLFLRILCAGCGGTDAAPVLRTDRYLLPVEVGVCTRCGLTYTTRNMAGEALHAFYRTHYRRYYEQANPAQPEYLFSHKHKLNAAYRWLRIREVVPVPDSVLEIGCGLGFFLDECRANGVQQWFGFEIGDRFRDYARTTLGLGDRICAEPYESVQTLPFSPRLVTLFHVLEHLEDPAGCLRWIHRMMDPEGALVIEVPDITGRWRMLGLRHFHTAHRWYFSPVTLCNLLAQHGFTPTFITRDNGDGIYPGNLRVFAKRSAAPAIYPLPVPPAAEVAKNIRQSIALWSWKTGLPRAVLHLVRQAMRG